MKIDVMLVYIRVVTTIQSNIVLINDSLYNKDF